MYVMTVPSGRRNRTGVDQPFILPDIDVMDTREALEVKLAELAAMRRTKADLRALEASIAKMASDIDAGGIGHEAAVDFHHAVTAASGNRLLIELMGSLSDRFDATRLIALEHPDRPPRSLEAHRQIAKAIAHGDATVAAAAMRDHLRVISDLWLEANRDIPQDQPTSPPTLKLRHM
jgi:GntR family transcriptional repressor for pyruvate dehydrogenase complex